MDVRFALGVAICYALIPAAAFGEPTESLSQKWFPNTPDRLGSRSHRDPGPGSKGADRKPPAWARDVDSSRSPSEPASDKNGMLANPPWQSNAKSSASTPSAA